MKRNYLGGNNIQQLVVFNYFIFCFDWVVGGGIGVFCFKGKWRLMEIVRVWWANVGLGYFLY